MQQISRIYLLFFFMLILISPKTHAQIFSLENSLYGKSALSPAYAGFSGNVESFVTHSNQWSGIAGAPTLTGINIQFPVFYQSGIMVQMTDYSTGNFSDISLDLAYAYQLKINNDLHLGLAVRPEFYRNQIELSQVKSQGTDPVLNNVSALKTAFFDIGGGMVFSYKDFLYGGISGRSIAGSGGKYSMSDLTYRQSANYTFHVNYKYAISSAVTAEAGYILNYRPEEFRPAWHQISVTGNYNHKLFGSLLYQNPAKIGVSAAGIISDNILLSYTYSFSFSGIEAASGGSHHVGIGFLIKRNTVNQIADIFPVSEQQQLLIENEQEMKELQSEVNRLKSHLNRVISSYDKRFYALEEKDLISDRSGSGNRKNLVFDDPFDLPTIQFSAQSGQFLPSSQTDLNRIVNMMVRDAGIVVRLTFFTKNTGSEYMSYDLARKRSGSISRYIRSKGIDPQRVITAIKISESEKVSIEIAH